MSIYHLTVTILAAFMWEICNEEELCRLGGAEPPEETVRRENSQKVKMKEASLNVSQPHTHEPAKKENVGLLIILGEVLKKAVISALATALNTTTESNTTPATSPNVKSDL